MAMSQVVICAFALLAVASAAPVNPRLTTHLTQASCKGGECTDEDPQPAIGAVDAATKAAIEQKEEPIREGDKPTPVAGGDASAATTPNPTPVPEGHGNGGFFKVNQPCTVCRVGWEYEVTSCTPEHDRECRACKECKSETEVIKSLCSGTDNTECACASGFGRLVENGMCQKCEPGTFDDPESDKCLPCPEGSYQDSEGQTFCNKCGAECGAGEYAAKACNGKQPRVCSPCATGFFKTEVGDQTCEPCKGACPSGQFEEQKCMPTSDVVCGSCPDGSFLDEKNNCVECTNCGAGQVEIKACDATSDAICRLCDEGSFLKEGNCTACTVCPSGEYPVEDCLNTVEHSQDAQCSKCPDETFKSEAGMGICTACCAACGPEEVEIQACTPTTGRICKSCNAGEYISDGECKTCSVCEGGMVEKSPCGGNQDVVCEVCPEGHYMAGKSCVPCDDECAAGFYEQQQCKSTEKMSFNRICAPCEAGKYKDVEGNGACISHSAQCPPGFTQSVTPSTTHDRQCVECEEGKFKSTTGSCACTPCTVCNNTDAGKERVACSATTDRQCLDCSGNFYLFGDGASSRCVPCGAECSEGEVQTNACGGNKPRSCELCPSGSYKVRTEGSLDEACKSCSNQGGCPEGTFQSTPCQNTVELSTNRVCTACPADSFKNDKGAHVCTPCSQCGVGMEPTGVGCTADSTSGVGAISDQECASCAQGFFKDTAGNFACVPCSTRNGTQAIVSPCTSESNAEFGSCSSGTYLTEKHTCEQCAPPCSDGFEEVQACTQDKVGGNRICSRCGSNQYLGSDGKCVACTECSLSEMEVSSCTPTANRVCRNCEASSYFDLSSKTCVPCKKGGERQIVVTKCGANTDASYDFCPTKSHKTAPDTCSPCSDSCPAGTYEAVGCGADLVFGLVTDDGQPYIGTTDRSCVACPTGMFRTEEMGVDKCLNCSAVAGPGEEEVTACSSTSDRKVKKCDAGFYNIDGKGPCLPCVDDCQAGFYQSQECSAKTPRVCIACVAGSNFSNAVNSKTCTECRSECEAGWTQVQACNAKQERVCAPCGQGKFKAEIGSTTCTTCQVCVKGKFETTPCGGRSGVNAEDRHCTTCPVGKWSAGNSTVCLDWSAPCGVGQYETESGSSKNDRVCLDCPENSFKLTADMAPVCTTNEVGVITCTDTADECTPCADACPMGSYEETPCSREKNRVCRACGENEYSDGIGLTSCKKCSLSCPDGHREISPCNATHDIQCSVCEAGMYEHVEPGTNVAACVNCSNVCSPGQYEVKACTYKSNRECQQCPAETFSSDEGQSECKPCSEKCGPGFETAVLNGVMLDCSSGVVDRLCKACPDGKFRSAEMVLSSDMCLSCSVCPGGYRSECTAEADSVCISAEGDVGSHAASVGLTQDIRPIVQDKPVVESNSDTNLSEEDRRLAEEMRIKTAAKKGGAKLAGESVLAQTGAFAQYMQQD